MSPLSRRHFIGALAAIPAAALVPPMVENVGGFIEAEVIGAVAYDRPIPIVFGVITDLPLRFYRAHSLQDAQAALSGDYSRLELIER